MSFFNELIMGKAVRKMVAHAQKKYEEGDKMLYFVLLAGIGAGKVPSPITGEHEYKLVIDTIHDYQASHPNKEVKEAYAYAISTMIRVIIGKNPFMMVINILCYEFEKQRNGTSAFRLDYHGIIQQLKDRVVEVHDRMLEKDKNADRYIKQNFEMLEYNSRGLF